MVRTGLVQTVEVSIHASTWEATVNIRHVVDAIKVSIHASTWEATCHFSVVWDGRVCFNPRLHVGGD